MSQDTPITNPPKVDKRKWEHLTPEQRQFRIERMQAGRKKKEPAAAPVATEPDPRDVEIADLKRKLTALLSIVDQKRETEESIKTADAFGPLPVNECYYEFPKGKPSEGLDRITSPDDPKWETLYNGTRRVAGGSFIVNELQRAKSGEILGRKQITGIQEAPRAAQERMRRFFETGEHVIRVGDR